MDGRRGFVPVRFCKSVQFDLKLSPHVQEMIGDVLVLVSSYVSELPGKTASSKFLSYLVYQVVMWLFQGVVNMLKDGGYS